MTDLAPTSERLQRLLSFWEGLRKGRDLPTRADFSPADIAPEDLPYLILLDVFKGGRDFTYRLVGTGVVGFVGREFTGLSISAYQSAHEEPEMLAAYFTAAQERRPTLYNGSLKRFDREFVLYERLSLPLAAKGNRNDVAQILAVLDFHYASGHMTGKTTGLWPHRG